MKIKNSTSHINRPERRIKQRQHITPRHQITYYIFIVYILHTYRVCDWMSWIDELSLFDASFWTVDVRRAVFDHHRCDFWWCLNWRNNEALFIWWYLKNCMCFFFNFQLYSLHFVKLLFCINFWINKWITETVFMYLYIYIYIFFFFFFFS